MSKKHLPVDKEYRVLMTNDGWLISDMFVNPIQLKSEINKLSS